MGALGGPRDDCFVLCSAFPVLKLQLRLAGTKSDIQFILKRLHPFLNVVPTLLTLAYLEYWTRIRIRAAIGPLPPKCWNLYRSLTSLGLAKQSGLAGLQSPEIGLSLPPQ